MSKRKGVQEQLQAILDELPAQSIVSSIAAVSCPRRGIEWQGAAGVDTPQGDPQITRRTFRLASVTKMYVAAAVLRLLEDGRLRLNQTVENLASGLTAEQLTSAGYDSARITVDHLLAHTSGLPDHANEDYKKLVLENPARHWTRAEQIDLCVKQRAPLGAPGENFSYSDTGYVILGEMIERLTGQPLGPSVRQLLRLDELELSQTWWETQELAPETAWPRCSQFIGAIDGREFDPTFDLYGGGGLISNVADMTRFVRALMQGQIIQDASVLMAALMIPHARRADDAHLHSRLAMVLRMGDTRGWGHLGFWGCGSAYNPEHDLAIALTINQATPDEPKLLTTTLQRLAGVALEGSE